MNIITKTLATALALAFTPLAQAVAPTLTDLGTLGGNYSMATGINASGQVIGNSTTATGAYHGFVWDRVNGITDLGTLGGTFSRATGINAAGQVFGQSTDAGEAVHDFVWDATNGMQLRNPAATYDPGPNPAVNSSGQTAAVSFTPRSFCRPDVGPGLSPAGNINSPTVATFPPYLLLTADEGGGVTGKAINEAGLIAGFSNPAGTVHRAVVGNATAGWSDLGTLGGTLASATGINASGKVVGNSTTATGANHGFLWDAVNGLQDVGTLNGGDGTTSILAINDAGQFVGTSRATGGLATHAFIGSTNQPPTAVAGLNQPIHAGTAVALNGSGSFDDNTATAALQYSWSFTTVPAGNTAILANATTATPGFTPNVTGDYVVELIVTDEGGLASLASSVTLSSFNQAPTAVATATPTLPLVGQAVALNGTASSDPELDTLGYLWTVTQRPVGSTAALVSPTSANTSLTPDKPGTYTVSLTASDFLGAGTPVEVTFDATAASTYAEGQIVAACSFVHSLPLSKVTTKGNQTAFCELLKNAAKQIERGHYTKAAKTLDQVIERTDGFPLRGMLDAKGDSRDWITDAAAQAIVYAQLIAARDALTGLQDT